MNSFTYESPKSLQEATSLLSKQAGVIRPLVGGSDLIDQLRTNRKQADLVMDIKSIPETTSMEFDTNGALHLGSAVSCADTYANPKVRSQFTAIAESCELIGSVQIQNRASAGGNVCNSSPSADTIPALLVHDAIAIIASAKGLREIALNEFFTGPGKNVLEAGEFLLKLVIPNPSDNSASHYLRFIPREEMDIAVAGAASFLTVDSSGTCIQARIALAAVAPTPIRAYEAENVLTGKIVTDELIDEASVTAASSAKPISDVRGSADYRKQLVKVLTKRTLQKCLRTLK